MATERISVFSQENREGIPIYPLDVYWSTEKGDAEVHSGATQCPAEMLEVLVLVDGKANVGDIEQQLKHISPESVRGLLRSLLGAGLIRHATVAEETGLDLSAFFAADTSPTEPSEGARASAEREAESGAPALRRCGATDTTSASRGRP